MRHVQLFWMSCTVWWRRSKAPGISPPPSASWFSSGRALMKQVTGQMAAPPNFLRTKQSIPHRPTVFYSLLSYLSSLRWFLNVHQSLPGLKLLLKYYFISTSSCFAVFTLLVIAESSISVYYWKEWILNDLKTRQLNRSSTQDALATVRQQHPLQK